MRYLVQTMLVKRISILKENNAFIKNYYINPFPSFLWRRFMKKNNSLIFIEQFSKKYTLQTEGKECVNGNETHQSVN